MDVPEKDERRCLVAGRNLRLERLEDVEVRVNRLAAVQVEAVFPFPAKGLARHLFEAGEIDLPSAEHLVDVCAEIFADHGDNPHLREKRRGDREIGGRAADDAVGFAKGRFDGIERDGSDSKNGMHGCLQAPGSIERICR